jgi:hypothetical protein
MARQAGPIKIEGTIGNLCFYRMDGAFYVRQKSSLSRKRVLRDPEFARSRVAAGRFGVAVKLASSVYRRLPKVEKGHGVIGRLTAIANKLLCAGLDRETALLQMEQDYLAPRPSPVRKVVAAADLLAKPILRPLNRGEIRKLLSAAYAAEYLDCIVRFPLARAAPVGLLGCNNNRKIAFGKGSGGCLCQSIFVG